MNNVSIYDIPNRKILINHALYLPLSLIFVIWCLPYKTPTVGSQHTRTPFSTVPQFNLGNNMMETFVMLIGKGFNVFRKKIKKECRKWSFNDMLQPVALYGEIRSRTISLQFSAFSLPRNFLQTFSNAFVIKPSFLCSGGKQIFDVIS